MPDLNEAERLLSTANDEIIEIGPTGQIYERGDAPALPGKRVPGITDGQGEYDGDTVV